MPSPNRKPRLLTVGDGNFSFSLALCKLLSLHNNKHKMLDSCWNVESGVEWPKLELVNLKLPQAHSRIGDLECMKSIASGQCSSYWKNITNGVIATQNIQMGKSNHEDTYKSLRQDTHNNAALTGEEVVMCRSEFAPQESAESYCCKTDENGCNDVSTLAPKHQISSEKFDKDFMLKVPGSGFPLPPDDLPHASSTADSIVPQITFSANCAINQNNNSAPLKKALDYDVELTSRAEKLKYFVQEPPSPKGQCNSEIFFGFVPEPCDCPPLLLAIIAYLKKRGKDWYDTFVFASSFDSSEEVLRKYPESKEVLEQFRKLKNGAIYHNVNAWELNKSFPSENFDVVVWNHPHLGQENYKLHRCLLSHYFFSASESVAPGGLLVITLIDGQAERWGIIEHARLHGWELLSDPQSFASSKWPGYSSKRNSNAKSFQNLKTQRHTCSDMQSWSFIFYWKPDGFMRDQEVLESHFEENISAVAESEEIALIYSQLDASTVNSAINSPELLQVSHPITEEGSKNYSKSFIENSKDVYTISLADTGKIKGPSLLTCTTQEFKCSYCLKTFKSAQGLFTHTRQVHELLKYGSNWTPEQPKSSINNITQECRVYCFPSCALCGHVCKDDSARRDHMMAKHFSEVYGELVEILKPALSLEVSEDLRNSFGHTAHEQSAADFYPCSICRLAIPNVWGMAEHLETLKPLCGILASCQVCGKSFIECRSLIQHQKHCAIKHYNNMSLNGGAQHNRNMKVNSVNFTTPMRQKEDLIASTKTIAL